MKALYIFLLLGTFIQASPLHKAVQEINEAKVHSFIDAGMDLNAKDLYLKTPLHYAASIGRYSLVKYLVEKGADIYAKDENHNTALIYAIEKNRMKVIIYLSKKENEEDKPKEGFFFDAAKKGDIDSVAYAVSTQDINKRNIDGKTALHLSAEAGHFNTVAFLLRLGADKKLLDHDGRTALNYAKLSGNKELYELLLRYSYDTN